MNAQNFSASYRTHLTTGRKLATACDLYWSARELKARALGRIHPDWEEVQVQREVRRIFLHSTSLNR